MADLNTKWGENTLATIIKFNVDSKDTQKEKIDFQQVSLSRRKIENCNLLPSQEEIFVDIAPEHTSEPIKDLKDIERISSFLIGNKRYRDNMLFITGINFGLRISDLLKLRFINLIDENNQFRRTFPILEQKTKNTRKVKKNRYITINNAVMEAVTLYLQHNQCHLDDYMFRSESNRGSNINQPMSRKSADRILKGIATDLNLDIKIATHTLRKTFAYHQMVMSNNDPRKLLLLQKIFGHSSVAQTLDYIGITREEIEDAYMNLNLGSGNKLLDSKLGESNLDLMA